MRNPVQKMFKAASQMKNNPPLAQQQTNSPNRINALAAQIVVPEQQAMQKSKPIPYPVGSVLMQRLAQAQQAAEASKYVDPREGGIAQVAAKSGGRLSFAEGGKPPKTVRPENTDFAKKARAIMAKNQQVKAERGELRRAEEQKGARYRASQERQKLREIERKIRSTREGYEAEQETKRVQRARAEGAEDFKKATTPKPPKAFDPADYIEGTPEDASYARRLNQVKIRGADKSADVRARNANERAKLRKMGEKLKAQGDVAASGTPRGSRGILRSAAPDYRSMEGEANKLRTAKATKTYEDTKADIARNREIENERQVRQSRLEGGAEALKTQEGRPVSPYRNKSKKVPPPDVAKRILKGREDVARGRTVEGRREIAEELETAKRERVGKSSVIGERGNVVPKEPATPDQKKRRSEKSKLMGMPEKAVPGKGLSKEAQQYLESQNEPRAPETTETLASKKPDVSMEEANQRIEAAAKQGKKANASSPATLTRDIHNAANTTIAEDPAMMEEITRLASEANATNPDMSANERGQYIADNASPETRAKFLSKMGPMLEKYGIAKGARGVVKGAGLLGAYESGANIANVMADPTKSKKDVASTGNNRSRLNSFVPDRASLGAGLGAFGGPLAPLTVPAGGLVGGIAGAYYGEPGVRKLKEYLGMDQEGPQATAKHAIPTTGDLVNRASDYFSGEDWNKSPQQREEDDYRRELMAREEAARKGAPQEAKAAPATTAAPRTEPKVPSVAGPGAPLPAKLVSADQGGIAAAPQGQTTSAAPTTTATPTGQGQQRDMYAGDTSEATPEGAIRKLQELQGPGYQYSQRVMDELESGKREQQAATVLDMMAKFGAGISNRDRYQGIHDAALLSSQAFTSGREREGQAQQRFLEGIIHNEQVPFADRKSAYDMYTKMQLASAQNEALRERSMIGAMSRMYGYDQGLIGKMLGGQGGGLETERKSLDNQLDALVSLKKEAMGGDTSAYDLKINSILKQLGAMSGMSGGQGIGEEAKPVRPWPTA